MNVLDIDEWRMTMQIKREVVQEAIDALEWLLGEDRKRPLSGPQDTLDAPREALAQPEPEPVAWGLQLPNENHFRLVFLCEEAVHSAGAKWNESYKGYAAVPLYLAPPAPEVPAGWKLVPIEPTDEMVSASWDCAGVTSPAFGKKRYIAVAYHNMLAAAPEYRKE